MTTAIAPISDPTARRHYLRSTADFLLRIGLRSEDATPLTEQEIVALPKLDHSLGVKESRKEIKIPKIAGDSKTVTKATTLVTKAKAEHGRQSLPSSTIELPSYKRLLATVDTDHLVLDGSGNITDEELFALTVYHTLRGDKKFLDRAPKGFMDRDSVEASLLRAQALMKLYYGSKTSVQNAYDLECDGNLRRSLDDFGVPFLLNNIGVGALMDAYVPNWMHGEDPILRPWKVAGGTLNYDADKRKLMHRISRFVAKYHLNALKNDGRLDLEKLVECTDVAGRFREEITDWKRHTEFGNIFEVLKDGFPKDLGWGKNQINIGHAGFKFVGKWTSEEGKRKFRKATLKSLMDAGLGAVNPRTKYIPGGFIIHFTREEFLAWRNNYFKNQDWEAHFKRYGLESPFQEICDKSSLRLARILLNGDELNGITVEDFDLHNLQRVIDKRKERKGTSVKKKKLPDDYLPRLSRNERELLNPVNKIEGDIQLAEPFSQTNIGPLFSKSRELTNEDAIKRRDALIAAKNAVILATHSKCPSTLEKLLTAQHEGNYAISDEDLKLALESIINLTSSTNICDENRRNYLGTVSKVLYKPTNGNLRESLLRAVSRCNGENLYYEERPTSLTYLNSVLNIALEHIDDTVEAPKKPAETSLLDRVSTAQINYTAKFQDSSLVYAFPANNTPTNNLQISRREALIACKDAFHLLYRNSETSTLEKILTAQAEEHTDDFIVTDNMIATALNVVSVELDSTDISHEDLRKVKDVIESFLENTPKESLRVRLLEAVSQAHRRDLSFNGNPTVLSSISLTLERILSFKRIPSNIDILSLPKSKKPPKKPKSPRPPKQTPDEPVIAGIPRTPKEVISLKTMIENPFKLDEPGLCKNTGSTLSPLLNSKAKLFDKTVTSLVHGLKDPNIENNSYFIKIILLAKDESGTAFLFKDDDLKELITFIQSNITFTSDFDLKVNARNRFNTALVNLLKSTNIREDLLKESEKDATIPSTCRAFEILDFSIGYMSGVWSMKKAIEKSKSSSNSTIPGSIDDYSRIREIAKEINKLRTGNAEIYEKFSNNRGETLKEKAMKARRIAQYIDETPGQDDYDGTPEQYRDMANCFDAVSEAIENGVDLSKRVIELDEFKDDVRKAAFELYSDDIDTDKVLEHLPLMLLECTGKEGFFTDLPPDLLDPLCDDFTDTLTTLWNYATAG